MAYGDIHNLLVINLAIVMALSIFTACDNGTVDPLDEKWTKKVNEAERCSSKVIDQGKQKSEVIGQFHRVFGETQAKIMGFVSSNPRWQSEAQLYDRYVVYLTAPLDYDRESCSFIGIKKTEISITEITKIEGRKIYHGDLVRRVISMSEWKKLVENSGDFSVIGIGLKKNDPIKNFDEGWRNWSY